MSTPSHTELLLMPDSETCQPATTVSTGNVSTLWVCLCLIMATCGPGGTHCRGNYGRRGFERFARRVYVSLSIRGQTFVKTVRNTVTSQMWLEICKEKSLEPQVWISTTLIMTLFLPRANQLVRLGGQKMPLAIVSNFESKTHAFFSCFQKERTINYISA